MIVGTADEVDARAIGGIQDQIFRLRFAERGQRTGRGQQQMQLTVTDRHVEAAGRALVAAGIAAEVDARRAPARRPGLRGHGDSRQGPEHLREYRPLQGGGLPGVGQQARRDPGSRVDPQVRRLADGVAIVPDDRMAAPAVDPPAQPDGRARRADVRDRRPRLLHGRDRRLAE